MRVYLHAVASHVCRQQQHIVMRCIIMILLSFEVRCNSIERELFLTAWNIEIK